MHGVMDLQVIVRKRQIRQSQSNRAHRTCGAVRYMPSLIPRFDDMLLSTFVFRRRVSRCPEGLFLLSTSPTSCRNFICTDAAHVPFEYYVRGELSAIHFRDLFPI